MITKNSLQRLRLNAVLALIYQATQIASGFVIPWLILHSFGSDVNGLIGSISQFLGMIAFLEFGVGAVVQSALYKPLAIRSWEGVTHVYKSSQSFFRKIGFILFIYTIVLIFTFPSLTATRFNFIYTGTLIGAIAIGGFAQYFFGITNSLLLASDQKNYITYSINSITLLLNLALSYFLIKNDFSIQTVKFASSLVFLLRPLCLTIYVQKNYFLLKDIKQTKEALTQKWNGIAQHIAACVLEFAPVLALTLFTSFTIVSVFTIYNLIIVGIRSILNCLSSGVPSLMGELWAKEEKQELSKMFSWVEWSIHTGTTFFFCVTALMIVPFVEIYSRGVDDANYSVPVFAAVYTLACACFSYLYPYIYLILIAGHYRQTQKQYLKTACLNVFATGLFTLLFGLIGAAIGRLVTMIYQITWTFSYDRKFIIPLSWRSFFKQIFVDSLTGILITLTSLPIMGHAETYLAWSVMALEVSLIAIAITFVCNFVFYRSKIVHLFSKWH